MANGLIDLQTDLKSLRYGNDKPYVTKDIGQAPGSRIGMEVQARIDDTSRIAQMLISKPGINYLLHEAQLQQINVANKIKNRGNKTIAGAVLSQLGNTLVGTAKILGSTLAQVPVNGTGLHFLKGFRTDTYLQPTNQGGTNAFTQFFGAGGVEGAPSALQGKEIVGKVTTQFVGSKNEVISPKGDNPKFTYNAPVKQDGDQGTNWNEKPNKQITDKLPPLQNSTIAKNGGVVNVTNTYQRSVQGETIEGPDGELTELPATSAEANTPETTATKGSIGISNNATGTVTSGEISIKPFEQSGYEAKRRSKLSTEDNIANALTGSSITLSGPQLETTATPGVKTDQNLIERSISNKDVKYDLGDNGNDVSQSYTSVNTYTGKTAKDVIGNALTGAPIPVSPNINDNIHPKETTVEKGKLPGSKDSKSVIGSKNQPNPGLLDKNKYSNKSTYKKGTTPKSDIKSKPITTSGEVEQPNRNLFETFNEGNQYTDAVYNSTLKQPLPNLETYYVPNQANVNTTSGIGIQEAKQDEVGKEKFTPNRDRGTLVFGTQKIQDFRNSGAQGSTLFSSGDEGYANIPTEDYTQYARETRVGLGSQGKRISRVDYNAPTDPEVLDKLNALDLSTTNPDGNSAARDFAKLYFEVLNPDRKQSVFIHFRAFLDSLDDSFTADWQSHKYVGRAEDFYTYGGFSRDINFSFKIAAATRSEMKPLYRKMVYLASTTAPTYGDSAFMRGTVVKLTLGSYLTQVPGVLTSIKYAWQTDYPWEIAMKSPESGESDVQELPMILDCSVTFKPIHDFAPQTGLYHYFTSKNTNQPGASPFFTEAEQIS